LATNEAPIPELEPGRLPTSEEDDACDLRVRGLIDAVCADDVEIRTLPPHIKDLLRLVYMQGYADGAAIEDRRIAAAIKRGEWVRPT